MSSLSAVHAVRPGSAYTACNRFRLGVHKYVESSLTAAVTCKRCLKVVKTAQSGKLK